MSNSCLQHLQPLPCAQCAENRARGYSVNQLAGRCANGAERDAGKLWHALPLTSRRAVCGTTYGRRSAGWSDYEKVAQLVTCTKCLKKLQAIETRTKIAERLFTNGIGHGGVPKGDL